MCSNDTCDTGLIRWSTPHRPQICSSMQHRLNKAYTSRRLMEVDKSKTQLTSAVHLRTPKSEDGEKSCHFCRYFSRSHLRKEPVSSYSLRMFFFFLLRRSARYTPTRNSPYARNKKQQQITQVFFFWRLQFPFVIGPSYDHPSRPQVTLQWAGKYNLLPVFNGRSNKYTPLQAAIRSSENNRKIDFSLPFSKLKSLHNAFNLSKSLAQIDKKSLRTVKFTFPKVTYSAKNVRSRVGLNHQPFG